MLPNRCLVFTLLLLVGDAAVAVRLDEGQLLGTHNSYHLAPEPDLDEVQEIDERLAELVAANKYTHPPLLDQLTEYNVRSLELDVYHHPEGGKFSFRGARAVLDLDEVWDESPEMQEPGFKVMHIDNVEYNTHCKRLTACLSVVRQWSDQNPTHIPLLLRVKMNRETMIETFAAQDPAAAATVLENLVELNFVAVARHAHALRAVRMAFPAGAADAVCTMVCTIPFLLDPVAALRACGPVPGAVGVECTNLVAAALVGVAARVCGGPAEALARDTLLRLQLPSGCGVVGLGGVARSPAQDADAAGCDLLDGVCAWIGSTVVRSLKRIATDMRFVAGDTEEESHLPLAQIVELEGVRVGMTHGHMIMPRGNDMALDAERRRLNVDVLLSASTGRASTKQHGSGLLVDPGSITGLPCSPLASCRPSFTLLSLDNGKVTTFTYSVDENGAVGFQRRDFQRQQHGVVTRPQAAPAPATAAPPAPEQPQPQAAAPAGAAAPAAQEAAPQAPEATGEAADGTQQLDNLAAEAPTPDAQGSDADPAAAQAPAAPLEGEAQSSPAGDDTSAPAGLPDEPSATSVPSLPE